MNKKPCINHNDQVTNSVRFDNIFFCDKCGKETNSHYSMIKCVCNRYMERMDHVIVNILLDAHNAFMKKPNRKLHNEFGLCSFIKRHTKLSNTTEQYKEKVIRWIFGYNPNSYLFGGGDIQSVLYAVNTNNKLRMERAEWSIEKAREIQKSMIKTKSTCELAVDDFCKALNKSIMSNEKIKNDLKYGDYTHIQKHSIMVDIFNLIIQGEYIKATELLVVLFHKGEEK